MFDSSPTHRLKQELRAMTPGTNQFAQRLRDLMVKLDADQARLDRSIEASAAAHTQGRSDDV